MGAGATWSEIGETWRAAFDEAWASWCAGSFGIGAVVTTGDGTVVSRGRNRILDVAVQPGVLAGTPLAHAEMNALAALPIGPAASYRLYTTLEPCLLCAAAIRFLRVPEVHFAGADPLFDGIHDHLAGHPYGAERHPAQTGPLPGPIGRFASLLPLTFMAFWTPDNPVIDLHRRATPELVALADQVLQRDTLAAVSGDGGTVADALAAVWADLS